MPFKHRLLRPRGDGAAIVFVSRRRLINYLLLVINLPGSNVTRGRRKPRATSVPHGPVDPCRCSWPSPAGDKTPKSNRANDHRTLQRPRGRAALAEGLGRAGHLRHPQRRPAAEILRAGDVPLPVGAHPHGARAQLHHGRRGRALQARARASTCCTRWAGTPSACRPRTPPWSARSIRAPGPTRTSPR